MKTNIVILLVLSLLLFPSIPTQITEQKNSLFLPLQHVLGNTNQTIISINNWSSIVVRDEYGIPHVFADTREELAFGVGYAIAQDRLWQADLFRREATGRLSELGIGNTSDDLWTRTRGYTKEENTQLFNTVQSPYGEMISAYAEGINLFIAEAIADPDEKMPYEYLIREITPEP